jgi:hypothetical protein
VRRSIGLLDRRDQTQERRLAAAVRPDDADPLALGHAERDLTEHGAAAEALDRFLRPSRVRSGR